MTATIRDDVVRNEAASDGCWPLVTNDRDLSAAELFASYRWQPNLECRHRLLKGPLHVAPVWLNSPSRMVKSRVVVYEPSAATVFASTRVDDSMSINWM